MGAGLLGEVETGAALYVVEEGFVGGGEGICGSTHLRSEMWGTHGGGSGRQSWEEGGTGQEFEAVASLHFIFR